MTLLQEKIKTALKMVQAALELRPKPEVAQPLIEAKIALLTATIEADPKRK